MIKLINIKRSNEFIEAHYLPEGSPEKGYVKLDLQSLSPVVVQRSAYEGAYSEHFLQAKNALKQLANQEKLPKEKLVMWY